MFYQEWLIWILIITFAMMLNASISSVTFPHLIFFIYNMKWVQFNSVSESCLIPCDPMDCNTPGFPVHHQLPWFAQTHVHQVGDAIQPSHLLLLPFPPAFNLSQQFLLSSIFLSIRVFSKESVFHIRWPKYWSFSFSINPSN